MNQPIGIFDSGMGGVSTLRALVKTLPHENFLYLGDSIHAPYGSRTEEEIRSLTLQNVDRLIEQGCKAVVVACNTATAAAIVQIREKYPNIPVIGLEPALKPAVLHKKNSRVVVMATPYTLRSKKFHRLKAKYENQAEIISMPCPHIVPFVERLQMDSPELEAHIRSYFAPYMDRPIDGIVLGCTHFPFAARTIRRVVGPGPVFFDSAMGVGRQVQKLLELNHLTNSSDCQGEVVFQNTKGEEAVALCRSLFLLDDIGE